jgi:hypothetical protein
MLNLYLPLGFVTDFTAELRDLEREYRDLPRTNPAFAIDPWLCERMAVALARGLNHIEVCAPEDYCGPYADVVRDAARADSTVIRIPSLSNHAFNRAGVAGMIADDVAKTQPGALWLQWMCAAEYVMFAQNDACEAEFMPIVLADHRDVRWFVAASVYTWATSGVWTAPYLRSSLLRMVERAPDLTETLRALAGDDHMHTQWMATYALEVLDGRWTQTDRGSVLTARYAALVRV